MLFAGIDGGQSSSVAAIGDERALLARGNGPPADLVGEPRDSQRQLSALEEALAAALHNAGLAADTRFDGLVAGLSGFDAGLSLQPDFTQRATRSLVAHDSEIAHAGALGGAPGIVVIAGTGSVALGNDGAEPALFARAGGWGYFFGDEGSALWIARTALRRAMSRADLAEGSRLTTAAFTFFGTDSLRAIQHAFAHGDISRAALAAFAGDVLACAREGDADAGAVGRAAAAELAALAVSVERRLGSATHHAVSYAGGVFRDDAFRDWFGEALRAALPQAVLVPPVGDSAGGALMLARRLS